MSDLLKCKTVKSSGLQSHGLRVRMAVILMLLATFGMAQTISVKGKVTEAETGNSCNPCHGILDHPTWWVQPLYATQITQNIHALFIYKLFNIF